MDIVFGKVAQSTMGCGVCLLHGFPPPVTPLHVKVAFGFLNDEDGQTESIQAIGDSENNMLYGKRMEASTKNIF